MSRSGDLLQRITLECFIGSLAHPRMFDQMLEPLIAQGLSSRGLADTLLRSERTIAKHVENILAKLHFTSRAQIAAWAVEKG